MIFLLIYLIGQFETLAVMWPLHVYQQKHPLNFVFLGLFTASLSLTVGVTCANTEGMCVLLVPFSKMLSGHRWLSPQFL